MPLNRVHKVLIQARTGPPRRSESNESIEHIGTPCCLLMLLASATPAEDRLVSCRIQQRSVLMRTDEERTGCRAKGARDNQRCAVRTFSTYSGIKGPQ